MNHRMFRPAFACAALLAACAQAPVETTGAPEDIALAEPVSALGLVIERAERMLDRGESAADARAMLVELLADPELTADERASATLALSRANEALGDHEAAIVVLEKEMARHSDDPSWSSKEFRERLRELVTGSPERQGIEPRKKIEAPPFARFLARYFPPSDDGAVTTTRFVIGGDGETSSEIGTFDVGAGIRAQREQDCPLCTDDIDVHSHRSGSDWLMIPMAEANFGDAMLVFYFDLGKNRIPARYERHLPMKVAEIERHLEAGKSFVMGAEREGAPPVVLIAAPRTALLEDVERHLAQLDRLPTEAAFVEVEQRLRSGEIQGVMRDEYFAAVRACYQTYLEHDPKASGAIAVRFEISARGQVQDVVVEKTAGGLDDTFLGCAHDKLVEVRFPATNNSVKVSYPIVFEPD